MEIVLEGERPREPKRQCSEHAGPVPGHTLRADLDRMSGLMVQRMDDTVLCHCQLEELMKKAMKIVGLGLLVLVVAAVAGLMFAGGPVIKSAVNTFGPKVLGVPVTLAGAKFMPFRGKIQLTKLHVGNPEGFKTPSLFDLGDMDIELDSRSLFTDTILIHKIAIAAPEITYERGLLGSNFSTLLEKMQGGKDSGKDVKQTGTEAEGPAKKVIIEQLTVSDPKLNVSIVAAGGHAIPIALGQVELKDIGKESGGVTVADAMKIILSIVTSNIENAVLGAGDLLGSGIKAVGKGVAAVGGAVVDGAAAVGGAVAESATAVAGAAVEGATAVAGAAAKGVTEVGGAVVGGAAEVGGAVAGGAVAAGEAVVGGAAAVGGAVVGGASSAVKGIGKLVGIGGDEKDAKSGEGDAKAAVDEKIAEPKPVPEPQPAK